MKRSILRAALGGALLSFAGAAVAQGFFLPATDLRLREDLTLLVDEGLLALPVHTWPLPAEDVRRVASRVRLEELAEPALQSALLRVQQAVAIRPDAGEWRLHEISMTAGEGGLLRHYGSLGRDNLEVSSRGGATNSRWSITLAATGVVSPDDNKKWRLDGSDITIRVGNWLFSANQLERWWGPGQFGSLILSTNARPMPQLSLDRHQSTPFSVPILRWIGPWRFSAFIGAMESERPDIDHPLFMGMRFSFQPVPILEIGLSRTAQFCGQNAARTRASCNLEQIGRVLVGKDNVGFRGVNGENEPGNQMAGIDLRLTSPFRPLPLTLYGQLIGEDSSDDSKSVIPNRFLGLFGAEGWWLKDSGSVLRVRLEYAHTKCKWFSSTEDVNCGYRQAIFFAGYRYRERTIGHTTDSDSESTALQFALTRSDGNRWGVNLWHATLDRSGPPDVYNPLTQGRSDYDSIELSWQGSWRGQALGAQLGYERRDGAGDETSGAFGFIQWRKSL